MPSACCLVKKQRVKHRLMMATMQRSRQVARWQPYSVAGSGWRGGEVRANRIFNQLLDITERWCLRVSMVTGVDSVLEIEFATRQGAIDLTNYHSNGGLGHYERGHEKQFKHVLYNILYAHHKFQQPVRFKLIKDSWMRLTKPPMYPGEEEYTEFPGMEPDEDIGSYELRIMLLAIRNLFTADYGDRGDWTYGRRTLRVEDQVDKIVCAIACNPLSPDAATAVLALQAKCDLPDELIQYASEYVNGYYAK